MSSLGKILGGLTSALFGAPQAPAAPPAPKPMPLPNDKAVEDERARKLALLAQRGGRMSTVLTDNSEAKLGG